jgi:hypothetical protein
MLPRSDQLRAHPQDGQQAQDTTTARDRPAAPQWRHRRPGLPAWLALFAISVGVVSFAARSMFLFADDFIFLNQARERPFGGSYLSLPLFQHFSPVTRIVNKVLVPLIPHWRAAPFAFLVAMDVAVVLSAILLMVAVFGRTWLAWLGALLLGTSLSLIPLLHWWTAGLNILPAMAGASAGFGAMVLYLRGRTAWWAVLAILGYLVAVTDYELGMLMPGYLALWLVLFGRSALPTSVAQALRRTWWAWGVLAAMLVASAVNYRLNYYRPAPSPPLGLLRQGLVISFFHALVPSIVGLHGDRYDPTWDRFSTAVGAVLIVALFGWTMLRNRRAWRGWAFALIGWLLPALALLINRVGLTHSNGVATNLIYQYLALTMFLVGVIEAVLIASDRPRFAAVGRPRALRALLAGGVAACVLVALGYTHSVLPTIRPQKVAQSSNDYVSTVQAGAAAAARGGPYGLLDATVPTGLVSASFAPYNRASRVVGLYSPDLPFDVAADRLFAIGSGGRLYPVTLTNLLRAEASGTAAVLTATGVTDQHVDPRRGLCFRTGRAGRVLVDLPQTVSGPRLVIRTDFTVSAPTAERYYVLPTTPKRWVAANGDPKRWTPGEHALLETVAATSITSVQVGRFTPGVDVCVSSVTVSEAVPAS